MPTARIAFLSSKRPNDQIDSGIRETVLKYLNQLENGYFKDINTIDWASFYQKPVPIAFSQQLIEYKFLPVILHSHLQNQRDGEYYKLYAIAIRVLNEKAPKYREIFEYVLRDGEKDLMFPGTAAGCAEFCYYYCKYIALQNSLFEPLFNSLQFSGEGVKALKLLVDLPEIAKLVEFRHCDLICNIIINYPDYRSDCLDLIGGICYRKDDLQCIFDSHCFSLLCSFIDENQEQLLWILCNLAERYHAYFNECVYGLIERNLTSVTTNKEYCFIILEQLSYNYDNYVEDFLDSHDIIALVEKNILNCGQNSHSVEHCLNFFRQLVLVGKCQAQDFYDTIYAIQNNSQQISDLVSDFLNQVM